MRIPFVKMHGLGNDFVVLDGRVGALPEVTESFARAIAERHTGIGCDQLIVLAPARVADADFRMRIFNADGGEVEACGNASRAVALLAGAAARVETDGGIILVEPRGGGARVDMGEPRFEWDAIPLAYPLDTRAMPAGWEELTEPMALRVGNSHVVFFVPDVDAVPLNRLGPQIETDPLFPERINVNIATVESRTSIRARVWERGAGLTRACGTGACAVAVAAMRRGLADRMVTVAVPGGELDIAWSEDNRITMTGPAVESFRGNFEWDDFA